MDLITPMKKAGMLTKPQVYLKELPPINFAKYTLLIMFHVVLISHPENNEG
jgi:hypothetical protein